MMRMRAHPRHHRFSRVAGALIVCIGLAVTACTAIDDRPADKLSVSQAADQYLSVVCPVNDAWNALDLSIDNLRLELDHGHADAADATQKLKRFEKVATRAATELRKQRDSFPKSVHEPAADVADALERDADTAAKAVKLDAQKLAEFSWPNTEDTAQKTQIARKKLSLSADATTSCDAWKKRQKAKKLKNEGSKQNGSAPNGSAQKGAKELGSKKPDASTPKKGNS
jgi:hypothetical protein